MLCLKQVKYSDEKGFGEFAVECSLSLQISAVRTPCAEANCATADDRLNSAATRSTSSRNFQVNA
jgi:hypothetical protein